MNALNRACLITVGIAIMLDALVVTPCGADTINWNVGITAIGQQFGTATNWSPQQIPDSDDLAVFDTNLTPGGPHSGTHFIAIGPGLDPVQQLSVSRGNFLFNASNGSFQVIGGMAVGFGHLASATLTLNFINLSSNVDLLNLSIGSTGELAVGTVNVNNNSTLDVDGLFVGTVEGRGGAINVTNNSTLDTRNAFPQLGGVTDVFSTATVTVTGNGSRWDLAGGILYHGSITATGGGDIHASSIVYAGAAPGGSSNITVTGAGSTFAANELVLSGRPFPELIGSFGSSLLTIQSAAAATIDTELYLFPNSTVNLNSGSLTAGTVSFHGGGTFNFNGGTLAVDRFENHLTQNGGTLAPGSSVGTTRITGDYLLNAGELEIEIGLVEVDDEMVPTPDRLIVDGNATLGGSLVLTLLDDLEPEFGGEFQIVSVAGTLSGQFTDLDEGDLFMATGGQRFLISYTGGDGNDVVLTAVPGVPGDYNQNGIVDAADYTVWRDHLGTSFALGGNGDESGASAGIVDQADYAYWVSNFGATAGSGSAGASPSLAAIPEPGTLVLASLCLCGGVIFLKKRGHH